MIPCYLLLTYLGTADYDCKNGQTRRGKKICGMLIELKWSTASCFSIYFQEKGGKMSAHAPNSWKIYTCKGMGTTIPPEEKVWCLGRKTCTSLCLQKKNVALNMQMVQVVLHVHSFCCCVTLNRFRCLEMIGEKLSGSSWRIQMLSTSTRTWGKPLVNITMEDELCKCFYI